MTTPQALRNSDWTLGLRVWVERAGQALLGPGRAELLERIANSRSISAAAREMSMSYRRAWLLVQEVNSAAGEPLVEAVTGGSHGGGAQLTDAGEAALAVYKQLREGLHQWAMTLLPRVNAASAPPILHVAAAVSLEDVLSQLLADYAASHPKVRVRTIFGASDELVDHLLSGAPAALFLSADPRQLDRLEAVSLIEPGSRRELAANSLAVIGRDEKMASVRTLEALLRQDNVNIVLADPSSPLGSYTVAYLTECGQLAKVLARATIVDNSRAVVAMVQGGRADAGLAYGSDASRAEGCRVLFRVRRPPGAIRCVGAILRHHSQHEPANSLLDFLASPSGAACFQRCGFLPVGA